MTTNKELKNLMMEKRALKLISNKFWRVSYNDFYSIITTLATENAIQNIVDEFSTYMDQGYDEDYVHWAIYRVNNITMGEKWKYSEDKPIFIFYIAEGKVNASFLEEMVKEMDGFAGVPVLTTDVVKLLVNPKEELEEDPEKENEPMPAPKGESPIADPVGDIEQALKWVDFIGKGYNISEGITGIQGWLELAKKDIKFLLSHK